MSSSPITSWEIDGQTVETVSDFILGAPNSLQMVIAEGKLDSILNLDSILKSKEITLPTKVHIANGFSRVMYGHEN